MVICLKCPSRASYGTREGKETMCAKHKTPYMINKTSTLCAQDACDKVACFGSVGGKRSHCKSHASSDMISFISKDICLFDHCSTEAWYTDGMCGKHRSENAVPKRGNRYFVFYILFYLFINQRNLCV
jgi:hypothetical protein